jgi:transcriptional regulator with XRE-family HTH domain
VNSPHDERGAHDYAARMTIEPSTTSPHTAVPGPDPIARRIRERRLSRGLSFHQLAILAGIKAPSHVFHIENGHKTPSEEVAARLARALEDDESLYRAWARARNRSDLRTTMSAALLLHRMLGEPVLEQEPGAPRIAWGTARLVVPVIPEGDDPGDGLRPAGQVMDRLRLDPAVLPAGAPLQRPFAWRVSAQPAHRMGAPLIAGSLAVFTRNDVPPNPATPCAIRREERVTIERAWWTGRVLVLMPEPDAAEATVLDVPNGAALSRLVVGHLVAVIPAPSVA